MFEYFKDNYAWNLAAVTLIEEVGTISEPETAFRKVAHLAAADVVTANFAWTTAMTELGERLEALGHADAAAKRHLSAARKYHRAAMYFIRAERMTSHKDPRGLAIYKRALENSRQARVLGGDPIEFVEIPYKKGVLPALFLRAEGDRPAPTIRLHRRLVQRDAHWPLIAEYPLGASSLNQKRESSGHEL